MKKSSEIKLYNMMFPLWMLIFFPITWIVVIPANFIIDTAVLLISIKCLKLENIKLIYKRTILKVFLFGFLCDFIGGIVILLPNLLPFHNIGYTKIISSINSNPFENIFAFICVLIATAIAGFFIYLFNYKISFKKLDIEIKKKKQLALSMAVFTAPYLFFFPSDLFYNNVI